MNPVLRVSSLVLKNVGRPEGEPGPGPAVLGGPKGVIVKKQQKMPDYSEETLAHSEAPQCAALCLV